MSSPEHILVVDESRDTFESLQRYLNWKGYHVLSASELSEALRLLDTEPIDLVITEERLHGRSLDLVRHVRDNFKETEVIVVTGSPTVEGAVHALKGGAEEYLARPVSIDDMVAAVRRVLEKLHARRASRLAVVPNEFGLVGNSDPMRKVYGAISKAATTTATTMIMGESGTGKELVARAIHYNSVRASAPFVPINCGGIPESLLESELFGHLKGAFTGASETRPGFFQTAEGGTIFLDEIADTSLSMQAKLLRVLEDKEVCMLGSTHSKKVDVRILAATNRDLDRLVHKGQFREDLFFRINVITISIPPLRERGDDIMLLTHHFAAQFATELGKPTPRFSDKVIGALTNCHWPGNVRELENLIHRLVIMTDGVAIDVPDLPSLMRFTATRGGKVQRTLAEVERDHIQAVLASVNGNKSWASEILGIDRKTLREKIKHYTILDDSSSKSEGT